jgi:phosphonate transport system substrate-binding protein
VRPAPPRTRTAAIKTASRIAALACCSLAALAPAGRAAPCPPGGAVRYGVVPFDSSAGFVPLFKQIGELISQKLGCPVEVVIGNSYTATIEAMRAGKLDAGEFGPLSYVLAHQVAKAEAVATYAGADGKPDTYAASIVTWPGSGVATLKDVAGRSFAYSDAASTSGHLFPAYGLKEAGIDPDKGVRAIYAGSHTASFEALRNHKVDAGELNTSEISSAQAAGIWDPKAYVTLWTSKPIPQDPIAVREGLDPEVKARLTEVLQHLDLGGFTPEQLKVIGIHGKGYVPQTDAAYDDIRNLVSVLHIDLEKL